MAKRQQKPKERNPWDRPEWPKRGTRSQKRLYEALGRALSEWEHFEGALSYLFSAIVAGDDTLPGRRAYNAVRTFEGRHEMLKAATEAHFDLHPDPQLQDRVKDLLRTAKHFSERRNDLAHGAIDYFTAHEMRGQLIRSSTFALLPSPATFRGRDTGDRAEYCYTAPDLEAMRMHFRLLGRPAAKIAAEIIVNKHCREQEQIQALLARRRYASSRPE